MQRAQEKQQPLIVPGQLWVKPGYDVNNDDHVVWPVAVLVVRDDSDWLQLRLYNLKENAHFGTFDSSGSAEVLRRWIDIFGYVLACDHAGNP